MLLAINAARNAHAVDKQNADLERRLILYAAYSSVLDLRVVASDELGLHAFQHHSWTVAHPKLGEHRRVGRLRPKRVQPVSAVEWIGDKGVIGYAHRERPSQIVWWRLRTHKLNRYVGCTVSAWEKVPAEVKLGFSYADWAVAQRYGGVVLCPVIDPNDRTYLGCVTLDCATDVAIEALTGKKAEVEKIVQDAANSMAKHLR